MYRMQVLYWLKKKKTNRLKQTQGLSLNLAYYKTKAKKVFLLPRFFLICLLFIFFYFLFIYFYAIKTKLLNLSVYALWCVTLLSHIQPMGTGDFLFFWGGAGLNQA